MQNCVKPATFALYMITWVMQVLINNSHIQIVHKKESKINYFIVIDVNNKSLVEIAETLQ